MMELSAEPIWIVGAGGFARCLVDLFEAVGKPVAGLLVQRDSETSWYAGPSMLEDDFLARPGVASVALAIGPNAMREDIERRLLARRPDLVIAGAVHPRAIVSPHAAIGAGCVVLAGAVVQPHARLGRNVVLYSGAIVEHDGRLEDYVTLGPGAVLAGSVKVGARTFIGAGATVSNNMSVGADCVVGAGATVVKSIPESCVAVGTPAKVKHTRSRLDPYL